jgi:hypothetical protein
MLMLVSLDLDRIKNDGYVLPDCYISMITCEAKNKYEALEQFRLRTGFSLNGEYVKCREIT